MGGRISYDLSHFLYLFADLYSYSLGLSPFLRGKLVDRLRQEEAKEKSS